MTSFDLQFMGSTKFVLDAIIHKFFRWIQPVRKTFFEQFNYFSMRRYLWLETMLFTRFVLLKNMCSTTTKTWIKLARFLKSQEITGNSTFEQFHSPGWVYLKTSCVQEHATWWYVGSTTNTPMDREYSRYRKYEQLRKGVDAFFEPALKIWQSTQTFFHFIIIPLQQIDDEIALRAAETTLIGQLRPMLNHPFVNPLLKKHGVAAPLNFSMPCETAGKRVHDRFSFLANCALDESAMSRMWKQPTHLFELLYWLGCTTRRKFHAAQVLRSSQVNLEFLYMLYKLVHQIDEPWRTRAQRSLKNCLEFKGGHAPPANVPMLLLPLQCDVKDLVRTWLRELLQHHSCLFPWFHVPTTHVVLRRNRPFSDFVFNFHSFLQSWSPDECVFECMACGTFDYGDHVRSTGHVFSTASGLFPTLLVGHLNLADTVFPSQRRWITDAQQQFAKWCERWRLGRRFTTIWNYMCHYIWQQHVQAVSRDGVCTFQALFRELRSIRRFVICPADHHPHRAHLCCPHHYHHLLMKTFMTPDVFVRCSVGWNTVFPRVMVDLGDSLPPHLRKLASPGGKCPCAYILPKPSKHFEAARPIIAYTNSWNNRLGEVIGGVVLQLIRSLFRETSLDKDVVQIMRAIHYVFDDLPSHLPINMDQQDLSGFFNSVPHSRMVDSVWYALHVYCHKYNVSLDSTITFQLQDRESAQRIFRGRYRRAGNRTTQVSLIHLPAMVSFLLRNSYFMVGRHLFKQVQGASMGSHFAPALCGLVAACQEHIFSKTFKDMIAANRLLCNTRYVDNRAMMGFGSWLCSPIWSVFTHAEFYGAPILLEEVSDPILLGVHVDTDQRTTTVRFHHDMSHYRSSISQGSDLALSSAFAARLLMVLRYTHPKSLVIPQIQDLCVIALRSGLTMRAVKQQLWNWAAKIRNNTDHADRTRSWIIEQILIPTVLDECAQ